MSAAVTTTASARRRSSRCHTRTSPSAARIGIANPNVTNRSAGSHPVTSANATPTNVSTNHERRIRPALPFGAVKPIAASGTETHWTYRVQRWTKRSRYALRSSEVRPARRRNASFDVSTSSGGAPGRTASSPIPSTAAPPSGGPRHPERLAPVAPPREGGRDEQDRDAQQEELRVREAAPREHERGEDGRPASRIVQQRARREERRRGDQVRDVPGREVDGERARQQPRERRPAGARPAADEGRGRETDRHPERDLERRGRLDDREPEGPLERRATAPASRAGTRSPTVLRRRRAGTTTGRPARRDPPGTPRLVRRTARGTTRAGPGRGPRPGARRSCSPLGAPSGP